MKPKEFPEKNNTFTLPGGENPLPVFQDANQILSCWELDQKEKLGALFFGNIWLSVMTQQQPPVSLTAFPPFTDCNGNTPDIDAITEKFIERKVDQFISVAPIKDEVFRKEMRTVLIAFLRFAFGIEVEMLLPGNEKV